MNVDGLILLDQTGVTIPFAWNQDDGRGWGARRRGRILFEGRTRRWMGTMQMVTVSC